MGEHAAQGRLRGRHKAARAGLVAGAQAFELALGQALLRPLGHGRVAAMTGEYRGNGDGQHRGDAVAAAVKAHGIDEGLGQ